MKARWPQALDGIKKILKEKAYPDARLTSDAAVRMAGHALQYVAVIANALDWTSELAAEVRSMITAVSNACSRNKTLAIHFQRYALSEGPCSLASSTHKYTCFSAVRESKWSVP
jgi:hypothetical protein